MKNIYVTGGNGTVGSRMRELGCSPIDSDVTDTVELDYEIAEKKPDIIVHLAAKTNVDYCEHSERKAYDVNVFGSMNVFAAAEKHNIPVVYISSDHIFAGGGFGNYTEDNTNFKPVNYYGFTKFGAEATALAFDNVKIVRSSSIIAKQRTSVSSYLEKVRKGIPVEVPIFMWRSFIHLNHFCEHLINYCEKFYEMPNILNLTGTKTVSWWRLIKEYARLNGYDGNLVKPRWFYRSIPNEAHRPARCGLDFSLAKSFGFKEYDYMDAIMVDSKWLTSR